MTSGAYRITLDQRSISSTGKIAFTEKLAQLEITDSQVPPYLIQSISNFCQTVFDLELPLYQSEMLTLLKLTQELASFCETANQGGTIHASQLKSVLEAISKLYPDICIIDMPGVYQLVEMLFDHSIIESKIEHWTTCKKNCFKFRFDELKNLPFELFQKIFEPILHHSAIKDTMYSPCEIVSVKFIAREDPRFLEFWCQHHDDYSQSCHEKIYKLAFEIIYKCCKITSPNTFNDYFRLILKPELDKACHEPGRYRHS